MPKLRRKRGATAPKRKPKAHNYVVVTNKGYGKPLQRARIYFEGSRPKGLKNDGSITFGKHILETLTAKFGKFRWIITSNGDSIVKKYGITQCRTSQGLLRRMGRENWDRSRDIKRDIVRRFFGIAFPQHFSGPTNPPYVPGTVAAMMVPAIIPRLSGEDKETLSRFVPAYVAAEASGSVNELKAAAQIQSLEALAVDLEHHIGRTHAESWWQDYVRANILLMQQGYIKALPKFNVALGETRFPDFCLVTHDNYLDILEIKKPDTILLRLDQSRGNYYWDVELSKAISQTENYIEHVSNKAAHVRSYLLDKKKIDIKAVRPRGIILAGDARLFEEQKQRDDFRLLSQGIKSITIVTYDELLARLKNYISVLRQYESLPAPHGRTRG
ncbi:MAG: hypothetical protein DMD33_09465 [Gemmatimonadetes bacterium]|nr:MAG: hypothetical protein DMD33_09465 [Gemmatimonadota bacterium]